MRGGGGGRGAWSRGSSRACLLTAASTAMQQQQEGEGTLLTTRLTRSLESVTELSEKAGMLQATVCSQLPGS
mgnify:CR=1 FL=1